MTPAECPEHVRFVQTNGTEADSIHMPRDTAVPVAAAYKAAVEFFARPVRPQCITWTEL